MTKMKEQDTKKKKDKKWLILLLLLLLLLLIFIFGFLLLKGDNKDDEKAPNLPGGVNLTIDSDAGEYQKPGSNNQTSNGVAIPGWTSLSMPANETEVTVDFYNPEANKDLYYLTFELRLIDNSAQGYEVLYTSGLVEPNLHIQKINLNRSLNAGTYDAVIHIQPYRMDENKTPTNNANVKVKLNVQ